MHQKKVFLVKKNGHFGGIFSPKSPQGTRNTSQKRVNDKVLGIGICKFEVATIKTTIMTYIIVFWTNIRKTPRKGCFLALKEPPGHNQELSQSIDKQNYVASN